MFGLVVVKASASTVEDPGLNSSYFLWDLFGSSLTSDLTIGTPVPILPGDRHFILNAGIGRPGVGTLWVR